MAKGWLMGLQFAAMLENGEYFSETQRADALAMRVKEAFVKKGVPLWVDSPTNQQFVILSDAQKAALAQKYYFEEMGAGANGSVVRFCTSWATTEDEIAALIADIEKL